MHDSGEVQLSKHAKLAELEQLCVIDAELPVPSDEQEVPCWLQTSAKAAVIGIEIKRDTYEVITIDEQPMAARDRVFNRLLVSCWWRVGILMCLGSAVVGRHF